MKLALLGGAPVRNRPFCPWPVYGEREEKLLLEVLHSGSWGGYSEKVQEFETCFARLQGARQAISCTNGTVALEVALRAIGVGCGDEVIVPPITFVSTATAVLSSHGIPIFADVEPATLNLSPSAVEAAITARTRAIIAVHFGGHPANLDALTSIAERHGLALIEDAAHAHGAAWRGIPVGNFGQLATFSFQAFKLVTAGEGGVVVTNSPVLAEKVWSLCNLGRHPGRGWYEHFSLGSNHRMTGFQAALLLAQLEKLPEQTRTRSENVRYFRDHLRRLDGLTTAEDHPQVARHPHYLVTLRYHPNAFAGLSRDQFLAALQAEGIPARPPYPYPLYRNPVFRRDALPPCGCGKWGDLPEYERLRLPESERICRDGIWLEHSVFLGTREDVDDVLAALEKVQRLASTLTDSQGAARR